MTTATARKLGELEWTLARLIHPRESRRARRYFGVAWSTDGGRTFTNAYPVDISVDGVALICPEEMQARRFIVTLQLENRRVQAAAECVSVQKGTLRGHVVWRIGARFIELAREVRALIDRFVRRVPLNTASVLPMAGILPQEIVRKILETLVGLGRLAPPRRGMQPLVRMNYAGIVHRGKHLLHSVKVESRIVHEGAGTVYHSQVYLSERFTKIEVIPLDNGQPQTKSA